MDKSIEKKLNELIAVLNDQEEISRYREIEKQMLGNERLREKIDYYKRWQQKVVLYEQKNDLPDPIEQKLDALYNELLEIPIYNEYSYLLTEINEVLQQITLIIEQEINQDAQLYFDE